jgi:hypothetical protein
MASYFNLIPEERIISKILVLRNEKVILDVHLAELYGVETRALKQAVKRNLNRFPTDFMFELDEKEMDSMVSHSVIPHRKYFGGSSPFAFTEPGVAMLSSVLKSSKAVEMNIAIIRTFVALRKMANNYHEILKKLHAMEQEQGEKFTWIFRTLEQLLTPTILHARGLDTRRGIHRNG